LALDRADYGVTDITKYRLDAGGFEARHHLVAG
jgi:hypothetical protein